jgi:hypothetical protein
MVVMDYRVEGIIRRLGTLYALIICAVWLGRRTDYQRVRVVMWLGWDVLWVYCVVCYL